MADILIRGVPMPVPDFHTTVTIMGNGDVLWFNEKVGTAIPLPEGHGRLGDLDAITKTICNSCDGACDVVQCDCLNCKADCRCDIVKEISDAPTIIEADLEWKMKNCCCFSNIDQAEGGTDDGN